MEGYFDAVQTQLSALCEAEAHRRRGWRAAALRPRPTRTAGLLALSAAITAAVVVLALGALSGPGHPASSPPTGAAPGASVLSVLGGARQTGSALGNPQAPVTVTLFSDLQCPVCGDFLLGAAFHRLVLQQVRTGRVRLVYRALCTESCAGGRSGGFDVQQEAAYAAVPQHRLWDFTLLFYAAETAAGRPLTGERPLADIAREVPGLNLARWQRARRTAAPPDQVRIDTGLARQDRVVATPTLVVSAAGARRTLVGAVAYDRIQRAIAQVTEAAVPATVIHDCEAHGHLSRVYGGALLRRTLAQLPKSVRSYTNCAQVIRRALRPGR